MESAGTMALVPWTIGVHGQSQIGSNNVQIINNHGIERKESGIDDRIISLPQEVTSFVGRKEVLKQLKEFTEETAFVVLHGGPCLGKSSAANKFAHHVKDDYHNIVWIDMRTIFHEKNFGQVCKKILQAFDIDVRKLKDVHSSSHLERHLRRLEKNCYKTMIILDKVEKFLTNKSDNQDHSPMYVLWKLVLLTAPSTVRILGVSRCSANEYLFPDSKNIQLLRFTQPECREFLGQILCKETDYIHLLTEKCNGSPLLMKILAKAISTENEDDKEHLIEKIRGEPIETAIEIEPHYLKKMINISLELLTTKEREAANVLSVFPSTFSRKCAEALCKETNIEPCLIRQLADKGIICFQKESGYSMHPFLQENIQKMAGKEIITKCCTCLITIYLKYLFKMSEQAFEKNKNKDAAQNFTKWLPSFFHMTSILDTCSQEPFPEDSSLRQWIDEQDHSSYFLLLRFLLYLVTRNEIRIIFTFMLDIANEKKSIIELCLDELNGKVPLTYDQLKQPNSVNILLETVMVQRRKLSKIISQNPDCCPDSLESDLNKLLQKVSKLKPSSIKAYYRIKLYNLLGRMKENCLKKDLPGAQECFENAQITAESHFGDSFWTINCYIQLALFFMRQKANKQHEFAEKMLNAATDMATRAHLMNQPKVGNLLHAKISFALQKGNSRSSDEVTSLIDQLIKHAIKRRITFYLCKSLQRLSVHDTFNIQETLNVFRNEIVPDKNFITMIDSIFQHKEEIIRQCSDKEKITAKIMEGKNILDQAMKIVKESLDRMHKLQKGMNTAIDRQSLYAGALFQWNRKIAVHCSFVMLASDRKPYAVEALNLADKYKDCEAIKAEQSIYSLLDLISTSRYSKKQEKDIVDITYLVYFMKMHKKLDNNQEKRIADELISQMNNCEIAWLQIKILAALIQTSFMPSESYFQNVEKLSEFLNDTDNLPTLKPFNVLIGFLSKNSSQKQPESVRSKLTQVCESLILSLEKQTLVDEDEIRIKQSAFKKLKAGLETDYGRQESFDLV